MVRTFYVTFTAMTAMNAATAMIKIESVQKKGKIYHPQVYVVEFKYNDAESQQSNMLNDMIQMTMYLLRCKRRIKKCTEDKFL